MTRRSLLLLGAGGHARACIDVVDQHGGYAIYGLIGSADQQGHNVFGHPVIGLDDAIQDFLTHCECAFVTVGQMKTSDVRRRLFLAAESAGYQLPFIISPFAYVSPLAKIGRGTIVMHGAVVNAGAIIGDNCIINSKALIEHDVSIGSHSHVSTGAIVNGGAKIGDGCFIGSGSGIKQGVTLEAGCLVGMGTVVRQNVCANQWVTSSH
jgi:sugar O-acyltransferase (sialic acid O-acetyltransferase NeuD family)